MKKKTMIASYLMMSIMIILTAMTINTGVYAQEKYGWKKDGRYYYYLDDSGKKTFGWKKLDGSLYYFNKKGQRVSGIIVINRKLYKFGKNGVLIRQIGEVGNNKQTSTSTVNYIKKSSRSSYSGNNMVYDSKGNLLGRGKKYISNASAYTGDTSTASGQRPRWGTIAVDPNVIPLGSKVYVPYFDKVFIANDTGGIIRGTMIDIFMKSSVNMNNFGRRNLEIYVLEK